MEKQTYYVAIGSGEILPIKTATPFDFEIEATEEEVTLLQELFDARTSKDWGAFIRAHLPYLEYHLDRENDGYDEQLRAVYGMIHKLGKPETRQHIESIGILDRRAEDSPF